MVNKKIVILSLLMTVAAAAYAQETPSIIGQLQDLNGKAVAVVPPPAVPAASSAAPGTPIKNFGVAIWRTAEGGQREGLVFRGAAPHGKEAFGFLGGLGVKTIIDFREIRHDDKDLCAANGIDCREFGIVPTPTTKLVRNEDFMQAFTLATDEMKAGRKVFIHCLGGHHRTGALVAALTIRDAACGKPFDKEELSRSLEKTLKEYGFYTNNGSIHRFTAWEKEIRGWAENFDDNQWLCQ